MSNQISESIQDNLRDAPSGSNSTSAQPVKSQRILACILCQQRKVRCDRKFPCANCIKSRAQCVPGSLGQRRRKPRFPERQLLDRLSRYEELLRQHNIPFEPLHKDATSNKTFPGGDDHEGSDEDRADQSNIAEPSTASTVTKSDSDFKAKSYWHAVAKGLRDPNYDSDSSFDGVREKAVRKAWDDAIEQDDHLLFCSRRTTVDIATLHPDPIQIFRLWQVYLDNVNPVLKITHTPSLQARIIEAVSNVANSDSALQALMFGIYCTAVLSLSADECQNTFTASKDDLLTRYRFGCQEALSNSAFLRSTKMDSLAALYLYLASVRASVLPPSLSIILGIAIRIAQRLGIHQESVLSTYTVVEAEMGRRLWWSLVLFDFRISEVSSARLSVLDPTWNCEIPLNVNDADLRPEMKTPPAALIKPTEAIFAVVRSEIGEFLRHAEFHLDYNNPALKPIATHRRSSLAVEFSDLTKLEERIENQYLRFCDEENPIHFITIWTARGMLAKCRLMEYLATRANLPTVRTTTQNNTATSYALTMLECDTKVMTSPLSKRFIWMYQMYFPFVAYLQLIQDLKKKPFNDQAGKTWEALSDNFEAWFDDRFRHDSRFFQMFVKIVLQAWEACEAAHYQAYGENLAPPRIVVYIREIVTRTEKDNEALLASLSADFGMDDFSQPMQQQPDLIGMNAPYTTGIPDVFSMCSPEIWPGTAGQLPFSWPMNPPGWNGTTTNQPWNGF